MRIHPALILTLSSLALASPLASPTKRFHDLAGEFERSAMVAGLTAWELRNDGPVASAYFAGYADAYEQATARLRTTVEESP